MEDHEIMNKLMSTNHDKMHKSVDSTSDSMHLFISYHFGQNMKVRYKNWVYDKTNSDYSSDGRSYSGYGTVE